MCDCGFEDCGCGCGPGTGQECASGGCGTGTGIWTGIGRTIVNVDSSDVTYLSVSHSLLSSSIYVQTLLTGPNCALLDFHYEVGTVQDPGHSYLDIHILGLEGVQSTP